MGNNREKGWGTHWHFPLILQRQPLFPHIFSRWTTGWGLGKQSSRPPEELERTLSLWIPGSWGNWLMSIPSHFPRYLKNHDSDRKKENILAFFKKSRKEDPVSLTSVHRKIMEQMIWEAVLRHVEDRKVIWDSQHSFMEGKTCLANSVAFYDDVSTWMDKGRAAEVIYLGLYKTFATAPHKNILLSKLDRDVFHGCTIAWKRKGSDTEGSVVNSSESQRTIS